MFSRGEGVPCSSRRSKSEISVRNVPASYSTDTHRPDTPLTNTYTFKPERFSSHSVLVNSFPLDGTGQRVVDVGGGEGYLSRILASRQYRVVCVAAPGSIAKDFPGEVEVVEADLDFKHPPLVGPFDYALCGDLLEHLRDPKQTLLWIRDLLRPGGKLIASLPNSAHAYVRLNVLMGRFPKHDRGLFDRTHLHFYSLAGWKELLAACSFGIEGLRATTVPIGLVFPRWRHGVAVQALERVSYGLATLWKTMFAYQFVIIAHPI